jgi:hypothetical protein
MLVASNDTNLNMTTLHREAVRRSESGACMS